MNEKKIVDAFRKVKTDMTKIVTELEALKSSKSVKSISEIKNFPSFKKNVENELKSLNSRTKDFENKVNNNHEVLNDLSKSIKEKSSVNLDNEELDEKFEEFAEMINERVSLEISNLKLELETDFARLMADVDKFKLEILDVGASSKNKNEKNDNLNQNLEEFAEMINEKVTLEVNSLKMEFTEEISKVYDRCFNEILEFKSELQKLQERKDEKLEKKSKKKSNNIEKISKSKPKYNSKKKEKIISEDLNVPTGIEQVSLYESPIQENEKKPNKLKKIAKWLFVDEEEENDLNDIKGEVKKDKNSSKKEDDLY